MKKRLSLLLVAALATLSLAACGGSASTAATEEKKEAATTETAEASADKTDLDGIKERGVLVVGITDFAPMDYKNDAGEWIGFDADLAKEFAKSLGVDVSFVEIDWDNKIMELNGGTVDCIWNGMTLTDEVKSAMDCSKPYCNNAQVVIVKSDVADSYQSVDSLSELNFAVESGSAGAEQAQANGLNYTEVKDQASALMEAAAGTCDGAIIDSLMAAAMVGEGTSYADLTYTIGLNSEEYGVGFRQGSDLVSAFNTFFDEKTKDGTVDSIAAEYGVSAAVIK